jgi:hypothetical protein
MLLEFLFTNITATTTTVITFTNNNNMSGKKEEKLVEEIEINPQLVECF